MPSASIKTHGPKMQSTVLYLSLRTRFDFLWTKFILKVLLKNLHKQMLEDPKYCFDSHQATLKVVTFFGKNQQFAGER